jgi:signal transduction histidine kinase
MFTRTTSIRGKITAGYLLGFLFLLVVASLLFVGLRAAEDEVRLYSDTSRFLDTTLEMRRFEKNFLLYGHADDLREATRYADSAAALLADGAVWREPSRLAAWVHLLASGHRAAGRPDPGPERAGALLSEYRALLLAAGAGPDDGRRAAAEEAVRERGRRITDIAERLSTAEAGNIQAMLRAGRRALVLLVVVFLLGTALAARMVVTTAIRPLKELEEGMQRIASGDYRTLPEDSRSDEVGSMHRAFNRMIHEVFEHRQEVLQSERLASLGTALAGIAHEINNPLSNISTSAEILEEENEHAGVEERRELVSQILSETERATDIIRTVLDFTRERPSARRSTNLLSAVRGSLILTRGELPAHVSVDVDVAADLEVLADKTKLEQAFINLLKNAIDAMPEGREGRIAVSARPAGEDDVEVVFRDTGAGIPRHLLDRVFDPFFTTKDVGKGTGLGLYVTHHIVEQHGGAIRVESAVGEGTTVVLTLPSSEPRVVAASALVRAGRG